MGRTRDTALLVGFPNPLPGQRSGRRIANSAALLYQGRVVSVHRKSLLPTYDVFDEWRYFEPAPTVACVELGGRRLGISICEDIWNDADFWPQRLYREDPDREAGDRGRRDPDQHLGLALHHREAAPAAADAGYHRPPQAPPAGVRQSGGRPRRSDLRRIQPGPGCPGACCRPGGRHDARLPGRGSGRAPGEAPLARSTTATPARRWRRWCWARATMPGAAGSSRRCWVSRAASTRRWWRPSPPGRWGPRTCWAWPCPRATRRTVRAATPPRWRRTWASSSRRSPSSRCSRRICRHWRPAFAGRAPDVTEENLQARVRGVLLMALSNKFGSLLLTTGNKSELAVGYCTLYGDMCGGLAVISDVPKTMVYQLAREMNAGAARDLPRVTLISRPRPSCAPIRPTRIRLPPYEVLDAVLEAHLEDGLDRQALVAKGFDPQAGGRRDPDGPPVGVQATAGGARVEGHRQGLRSRPALSDRPRVPG